MKRFIPLLLLCVGCTQTEFVGQNGVRLKRTSFLQRNEIGLVELKPNGTATMKGYKSRGDVEMLGAAFEAGMNAAANKAVPVP